MGHCLEHWKMRLGTVSALMVPAMVILVQVILIGQAQGTSSPLQQCTLQQQPSQPLGSMCFGFAALAPAFASSRRTECAITTLSLRMQSGGRGDSTDCDQDPLTCNRKKERGRGGQKGGRGGKRSDRTARRNDEDDEDKEISTYVTCPNCMADSFIEAEVLGESKRLKCSNCDRSFNATADQLRDINAVYSVRYAVPTRHVSCCHLPALFPRLACCGLDWEINQGLRYLRRTTFVEYVIMMMMMMVVIMKRMKMTR
eukprot:1613996-Rhodomonas_salina.2